jgi:hypothetical protein
MSVREIAILLVDSIVNKDINHLARVRQTDAYKSGQQIWETHSKTGHDIDVLRVEILSYYNDLSVNKNGIDLLDTKVSGFFSKILTEILQTPIRLDFFDVSALGHAVAGFIAGVIFFGRDTADQLIREQFQQYKENNVNTAILSQWIVTHFKRCIQNLNANQINIIRQSDILNATNTAFSGIFRTPINLTLHGSETRESDNAMKQLAEKLDRLNPGFP